MKSSILVCWKGVNLMKRFHSRQKGFTLIELMIVILIIAILVAIAVPIYSAASDAAKKRTCQANLRTIDSAINSYNGYYNMMPGNGTVLSTLGSTYLKRDPTCPSSGTAYTLYNGNTTTGLPPITSCPTGVAGHSI